MIERAARLRERVRDDSGSAVVEFVFVGALLTVLTLSVLQLALSLHIRNTVLDAAAEGARTSALADRTAADGIARTRDLIAGAIGPSFAGDVTASTGDYLGLPATSITVRAPLPVFGLLGPVDALEVTGHAAVEQLG
ncbi:MAG: hypothetical protein RI885_2496 [Actinomycetota bacterium]